MRLISAQRPCFAALTAIALLVTSAPAFAGPSEEARAVELFEEAALEYQAGRFAQAVELLLEAQRLDPDPILHYNLARAYEGMGDLARALASYRAYVQADPNSKDRGAMEARIKTLEQLRADRERVEAPPPVDTPKPAPVGPKEEPRSPSPVPWVIAGIGVLGFGAGGALGGLCLARGDEAEDPATSGVDAVRLRDESATFAMGANIAFAVSGAVVATGVIWGIVDVVSSAGPADETTTAIRLDLGPTGARLSGTF